ncbi:MAG: hypothetical protein DSY37_01050 [Hyperthermus sp.]|nr:MAG: hypothetical protein DSY37_01050 [Hyperthermus sp.]
MSSREGVAITVNTELPDHVEVAPGVDRIEVGFAEVVVTYRCPGGVFARKRRCSDDIVIGVEYDGPLLVTAAGEAVGRLLTLEKLSEESYVIRVARGTGSASARLLFKVYVRPLGEEGSRHVASVKIYRAEARPVGIAGKEYMYGHSMIIEVMNPLSIDAVSIRPSSPVFFVGDEVELLVSLSSSKQRSIALRIEGPGVEEYFSVALKSGENLVARRIKFNAPGKSIAVRAEIVETGFTVEKTIPVHVIEPPRTRITAKPEASSMLGKPYRLLLVAVNKSPSTTTKLAITGNVYTHIVKEEVSLSPGETRIITLNTERLSESDSLAKEARIRIVEHPGPYQWDIVVSLPQPQRPRIEVLGGGGEAKLLSSEIGALTFTIENGFDEEIEVDVVGVEIEPMIAEPVELGHTRVAPGGRSPLSIALKPRALGNATMKLDFSVKVAGKETMSLQHTVSVEVKPSFSIKEVKAIPNTTKVLPGQKIKANIVLEYMGKGTGEINILSLSRSIEIAPESVNVTPGVNNIEVEVNALETGRPVLLVSDGICEEQVKLPFSIVDPEVKVDYKPRRIIGGVVEVLEYRVSNPFMERLRVHETIKVQGPLRIVESPPLDYVLEPSSSATRLVKVIGVRRGDAALVVQHTLHAPLSSRTQTTTLELSIEQPITIRVEDDEPLLLPLHFDERLWGSEAVGVPVRILVAAKRDLSGLGLEVVLENSEVTASGRITIPRLEENTLTMVYVAPRLPLSVSESLKATYRVQVGPYFEEGSLGSLRVARGVFAPILYETPLAEECPYPSRRIGGLWEAAIPVRGAMEELCGRPHVLGERLLDTVRMIESVLETARGGKEDELLSVAMLIYNAVGKGDPGSLAKARQVTAQADYEVGDGLLIPQALAWAALLRRVLRGGSLINEGVLQRDFVIGPLILPSSRAAILRSSIYAWLVEAALDCNPYAVERVLEALREARIWEYGLASLVATTCTGKPVSYSEATASIIYGHDPGEYVLYLTATRFSWLSSESEYGRLKKLLENVAGKLSGRLALGLALLYESAVIHSLEVYRYVVSDTPYAALVA